MKYRVLCHILVFLLCVGCLSAQTLDSAQKIPQTARNVVFVEGLGNGIFYSINYERFVSDAVSLRAGFSWLPAGVAGSFQDRSTLPILVNYFLGQGEHRCELGVGLTAEYGVWRYRPEPTNSVIPDDPSSYLRAYPTARLGYRFQPVSGGLTFGAAFTPFFALRSSNMLIPWGGISLGWGF